MRMPKAWWGVSLLLATGCRAEAPKPEASKQASEPATTALDEVLRSGVERKRVPGVIAVVATPAGVAYRAAFGMSPDAIVAMASMTKPVTSLAVLQLVDAGKVKLDEPASTYLPELAAVKVLDNGRLRPPKSPPTVRQLLSHTSGFAYEFLNRELSSTRRRPRSAACSRMATAS